ncbi:MAG TPA: hypothetical protein PK177_00070 [Burkholderiaceae bacterium]|nr:hypothetical protein [Burkholderiaceae bacterium]
MENSATPQWDLRQMQEFMLLNAWEAAREDISTACLRFGMQREMAARLAAASASDVYGLASRLGGEPIFVIRKDFEALLASRHNAQALIAASHAL